jgi:hypothetical protein
VTETKKMIDGGNVKGNEEVFDAHEALEKINPLN